MLDLRRRDMLMALGLGATWPLAARAQQQPRMLRVGYVGIASRDSPPYASFRKRMAELGYQEGRNFTFEYIQTPDIEGYEPAYRDLAARKIDVFLAVGSEAALRAAQAAAGRQPIAFLAVDFDPMTKGYVASLKRPGGNITGILVQQIELAAKRIELLREVLPEATRVGLLFDAASRDQADAAAAAARTLGLTPVLIESSGEKPDYPSALRTLADERGRAVVVPASPHFLRDRAAIGLALTEARVPAISASREIAVAGALMSYGVDLAGLFSDIAGFVDRLAKGGKPEEMPIELATRFRLTINLKAAARLGVTVSSAITARADEVIE